MSEKEMRLNRVLSGPLSALLLKTPLTPNAVTFLSLAFGILAGFLFSRGTYAICVAGALSYQLAVILDNCDGEIARAKNMRSQFGGWLDIAADLLTDLALFSGIAWGLLRQEHTGPVILFAALCLSGSLLHSGLVVFEKLKGFGPAVFEESVSRHSKQKNIIIVLFDALREGDASWLVMILAFTGQTAYLLWLGALYMQLLWLSALFLNFKRLFAKT